MPALFYNESQTDIFIGPPANQLETVLQEKFTLLCMLDHYERCRNLQPHASHHTKYLDWMGRQLDAAREGRYEVVPADEVAHLLALSPAERTKESMRLRGMLVKLPKGAMATGSARVRENCEAITRGEIDPLTLLLRGNTLMRIYDIGSFDHSGFMQSFSEANPHASILEVGAGTGGTTAKFIGNLSSYERYTFSDISAGFFPRAKQRFAAAERMDFLVFDVSKSPTDQEGLEKASYDLIIAPQVLHATPSLHDTLNNVRCLLKPGGYLVLTETIDAKCRTAHYFFGVFEGWWLGDADGRSDGPCVSPDRWDCELRASGFSGLDHCVLDAEAPYGFCALMVAHAM